KYPGKAIEIGQTLMIVVGVALTLDRLANIVADEFEWAGAENVLLVPVRVLVEDRLLVNPSIGIGQSRQERVGGEFKPKDHGDRIGDLDLVDHDEIALSGADHPRWREDDLVPDRGDILGCQWRAVGEFDPLADLEGIGLAVIDRLRHGRAQIADKIVRLARIVGVGADQDAVEGAAEWIVAYVSSRCASKLGGASAGII